MSKEIDEVRSVAQTFFDKMRNWEERSSMLSPASDTVQEDLLIELKRIFGEHLTQKSANRKQGRYASMHYTNPPEFSHQITKVEPAEPGAYWVQIPEPLSGFVRYHFVKEKDSWKVDYRQVEIDDDKWQKELDI